MGRRLGLSRDRRDEFVLAAHEVACNTVRHGGGHGVLRLYAQHGALHCEVSDKGPGCADEAGPPKQCSAETAESGRDLCSVQHLTDHVEITTGPTGTIVTFSVTLSIE